MIKVLLMSLSDDYDDPSHNTFVERLLRSDQPRVVHSLTGKVSGIMYKGERRIVGIDLQPASISRYIMGIDQFSRQFRCCTPTTIQQEFSPKPEYTYLIHTCVSCEESSEHVPEVRHKLENNTPHLE